jgi:crotonobetainyl-CoA:carnitine CoA-transferase CaiB-like acyl-CoA transferase
MSRIELGNADNESPLAGVRVIELGAFITAPLTAQLLADLGAEVVKIEQPPKGDPFRGWESHAYSPVFYAFNRSKQSLAVDLKTKEGQEIGERLLRTADVVVHNFRPGVAERLRIDYETVRALNPSVVYCAISGMGEEGPYRDRPSYDTVGQSLSGLLGLNIDSEQPEIRGPALSDTLTGIYGALAITAALREREKSGQGDRIALNMLQATMSFLGEAYSYYFTTGQDPSGKSRPANSLSFVFRCRDALPLSVHLSSPVKFWQELLVVLDLTDLAADPRFASHRARTRHYDELKDVLAPIFDEKVREEWLKILGGTEIPHAPVYRISEAVSDPQIQALEPFRVLAHPSAGSVRVMGPPFAFERSRLMEPTLPPELGQHTRAILSHLGMGEAEIARLRSTGVIAVQEKGNGQPGSRGT